MRYADFSSRIEDELRRHPDGLTWVELNMRLELPYPTPCPTWLRRMEEEIGLGRHSQPGRPGRAMVWRLR